jgi:ADP-heptose:LPS heptosyltransferase
VAAQHLARTARRADQPDLPPGYILVCPKASMRLRDMPDVIHARVLRHALASGPVVTQGRVPDALVHDVIHVPPCATLDAQCGLVRHAKCMISTDTAMVHLADAFGIPCIAFFPTHRPEWRVRDYPRCQPIALQSRLPPGIEFARGPGDDMLAESSWFPDGDDLSWLDRTMSWARERLLRTSEAMAESQSEFDL